jgi:hypothetical protein
MENKNYIFCHYIHFCFFFSFLFPKKLMPGSFPFWGTLLISQGWGDGSLDGKAHEEGDVDLAARGDLFEPNA